MDRYILQQNKIISHKYFGKWFAKNEVVILYRGIYG